MPDIEDSFIGRNTSSVFVPELMYSRSVGAVMILLGAGVWTAAIRVSGKKSDDIEYMIPSGQRRPSHVIRDTLSDPYSIWDSHKNIVEWVGYDEDAIAMVLHAIEKKTRFPDMTCLVAVLLDGKVERAIFSLPKKKFIINDTAYDRVDAWVLLPSPVPSDNTEEAINKTLKAMKDKRLKITSTSDIPSEQYVPPEGTTTSNVPKREPFVLGKSDASDLVEGDYVAFITKTYPDVPKIGTFVAGGCVRDVYSSLIRSEKILSLQKISIGPGSEMPKDVAFEYKYGAKSMRGFGMMYSDGYISVDGALYEPDSILGYMEIDFKRPEGSDVKSDSNESQ